MDTPSLEAGIRLRLVPDTRAVRRNGQIIMNPAHFGSPDGEVQRNIDLAASLMARIYTAPLNSQQDLAKQLAQDNPDAVTYMWYEAAATCHSEIRKALEASGGVVVNNHANGQWMNDAIQSYVKSRMDEVFNTDLDEKTEASSQWLAEFPDRAEELLFEACVRGDPAVAKHLLRDGVSPQPDDDPSLVVLHAACANGNLECAKLIREAGIEINQRDEFGGTPLMRAAVCGKIELVRWLLESGADATLRETREANYNALEYGAAQSVEIVGLLLEKGCVSTATALAAAASSGNEQSFDLLFDDMGLSSYSEQRADMSLEPGSKSSNARQTESFQAISMAGRGGSRHIITSLLDCMAPLPAGQLLIHPDSVSESKLALHEAIREAVTMDHLEATELLLRYLTEKFGAEVGQEYIDSLLIVGASCGSMSCTQMLLEKHKAQVNHLSKPHLASPLWYAVKAGRTALARLLVEKYHANIHQSSGKFANGPTPLWFAINQQNEPMARTLLALRGPIEYRDPGIDSETRRVFLSAAFDYRAPVRLLKSMESAWEKEDNNTRFLCLQYPAGFDAPVQRRRPDHELKDERELRLDPNSVPAPGFVGLFLELLRRLSWAG